MDEEYAIPQAANHVPDLVGDVHANLRDGQIVAAEDARWMLDLLAGRIVRRNAARHEREHGLNASVLRRSRDEDGQILIMFVMMISLVFIIAAVAIDYGMWLSERRGIARAADTTQQKLRGCIIISSGLGSDISKCLDMTFQ